MIIKFIKELVCVRKETDEEVITPHLPNELIHRIQSLLPAKEVARTCVLSKSWLHAWSTYPTRSLAFTKCAHSLTRRQEKKHISLIDLTLLEHLYGNKSIECLHLHLDVNKGMSFPSPVKNWFRELGCTNCVKELFLTICGTKLDKNKVGWLTIPDATIFSCESLNTLSLRGDNLRGYGVRIYRDHGIKIKCSFLRVLELVNVCISAAVLHNIFSSCSLLEKINLDLNEKKKTIKVNNLRCLRELKIRLLKGCMQDRLVLYDLPNLELISYRSYKKLTIRTGIMWCVRELCLSRVTLDDAFSDMMKSKFPLLETLTLAIDKCVLETCEITSFSLKRLTLCLCLNEQINIQIYASKLHYFSYDGVKMPSLLFPSNIPAHIKLTLRFSKLYPIDMSYFLKVREALDLSSSFDIETIYDFVPLDINLDDLRRMVPFPARNVQQLSFGKHCDRKLWNHSPLFDFLFAICHPRYVKTYYRTSNNKNYLYKQMAEMMEKKARDLKDINIKNPQDGKWESLTSSWRNYFLFDLPSKSFYGKGNDYNADEFRLNWLP